MGLMTYEEANCEALARFPGNRQKQRDFINSWMGLYRRRRRCREKILNQFGNGRRSRRNRKSEIAQPKKEELVRHLSFWQMLKIRISLLFGRLKRKFRNKQEN